MMRRVVRLWERHDEWRTLIEIINSGVSLVSSPHPIGEDPAAVRGYLERLEFRDGHLNVAGWALREGAALSSVKVGLVNGARSAHFNATVGVQREDVMSALNMTSYIAPGFIFSGNEPIPLKGDIRLDLNFSDGTRSTVEVGGYDLLNGRRTVFKRVSQFARFYMREVVPRLPLFVSGSTRAQARKEISRKLDTQLLFAGRKRTVSAERILDAEPAFAPLPEPVDIVVPVYNGYELLQPLFSSVAERTSTPYRLIVVDDASTDPRVRDLLASLKPANRNCQELLLLRNDTNLGFVKSVNRGLAVARHHVVILNTDVKVPSYWLERLARPLFDDPTVASTTPFTNRGTICSFPTFCRDNELIFGLPVEQIDRHFRVVVPSENPVVMPTGIGFCMGLNKRFLQLVGDFDAETFGRGYGEENDWCCKAAKVGGLSVMVENLFVEHDHGGTFTSAEKKLLLEDNLSKLSKRHPRYFKDVSQFISRDPASDLRALMVARIAASGARTGFEILLDHDLGGGANKFRDERIARHMKRKNTAFALILPNGQTGRYEFRVHCGDQFQSFYFEDWSMLDRLLPETAERGRGRINWVVNNLVGFHDVPAVLHFLIGRKERNGNALTVLMHDYLPACPSYNLLDKEGKHCGVPDIERCRACLGENPFAASIARASPIDDWRAVWGRLLWSADRIVHFSKASRDVVLRAYPGLDGKMVVKPHTVGWAVRRNVEVFPMRTGEPLRIGVVGAIGFAKGAELVIKAANIVARKQLKVEIVVLGRLSKTVMMDKLRVLGPYKPQDLPALIEKERIHVFWIPSIWPETFSYVTTELMRLNVPIACFNLGAPRERIATYKAGAVIPRMDAASAIKELLALAQKANLAAVARRKATRARRRRKAVRRLEAEAEDSLSLH